MVHLAGVDTTRSGMDKGWVKEESFWNVAGNSKAIKNNNKDRINPLVIIIFSRKVCRYQVGNQKP